MRIFEPSPSINYDFISSMYFAFSAIGTILYLLETQLFAPYKERSEQSQSQGAISQHDIANVDVTVDPTVIGDQEQSVLKELSESTAGLYLIFIPFIPCLFWSLVVRKESKRRLLNNTGTDTGIDSSSKKKD
jgi:hypothetical protein